VASAVPPASKPDDSTILGSPMKRHRPSVSGPVETGPSVPGAGLGGLDGILSGTSGATTTQGKQPFAPDASNAMEEEEEL